MSEISDMIQRLCPDGVEYRKLGEVVKIMNGKDYKSHQEGNIPVYGTGGILTYIDTAFDDGPTVLLPRKGSIDKVYYVDSPFWTVDTIYWTKFSRDSLVCPKFLYYFMTTINLSKMNTGTGAIPSLTQTVLSRIEIPVPPLEVQRKIVEVLDNFSELTAELTAELEARKKQYEYYRDNLLNFNRGGQVASDVKWMKLGEIGEVRMCKRVMKHQTNTESGIPFYKIGTFGKTADSYISQELYNELRGMYSYPKCGDILISASGTIGRTVVYDGEDAYYQDSNIVWIDNDESIALNSYLKIVYQVIDWRVEGGTIKRLYNDIIKNTVIPIPPLSEQERIVSILDRFESLTTDLTAGLPAEIKARQQQYGYYRDQLLTFKRAN
ncbi:MAG: restriction endonuclease subunit S [Bacteroides fragilis]